MLTSDLRLCLLCQHNSQMLMLASKLCQHNLQNPKINYFVSKLLDNNIIFCIIIKCTLSRLSGSWAKIQYVQWMMLKKSK